MKELTPTSRGIVLMLLAVLLFSLMDVMAKALGERVGTVMTVWARYAGQTLVVTVIVAPRLRAVLKTHYPGLQLLRSIFLLGATGSFFYALTRLGLAEASAIMMLNPVLITLGAWVFLNETIGARRIVGISVAVVGAMIVIRPGSAVFSLYSLLPLAAAGFYSAYALTTRFVGRAEDAWTSLFYTALLGAILLSAVVPFFWVRPDVIAIAMMLAIGLVGGVAQLLLIRALMEAEASMLAPFSYVGLFFAAFWGFAVFGDVPDRETWIGALVIVLAGLYVWHRETRRGPTDADQAQPPS